VCIVCVCARVRSRASLIRTGHSALISSLFPVMNSFAILMLITCIYATLFTKLWSSCPTVPVVYRRASTDISLQPCCLSTSLYRHCPYRRLGNSAHEQQCPAIVPYPAATSPPPPLLLPPPCVGEVSLTPAGVTRIGCRVGEWKNTYMHTHMPALAHRVSRPRGTGSVGDSVGEGSPPHNKTLRHV